MKSKINFKLLVALTSTVALVACNSGGASGGGDTPPGPGPSPTPETVLPLQITQNVIPSLNKVAGHKTWYMVIKNPNSISVLMNPWLGSASPVAQFGYDTGNTSPVNPTQFAKAYDGAISGVTQDCLNYITNEFYFPAGASCAFKFEAQWNINTSIITNYNFYMSYSFMIGINPNDPYDETNKKSYEVRIGCVDQPQYKEFCLNNNQNLQVNVMQVTQTANDIAFSYNSFHIGRLGAGNRTSYDGSKMWSPQYPSAITYLYAINYNPINNTYSPVLTDTYNQDLFYDDAAIPQNGNNYYGSYYNQNGIMTSVESTDPNLKWATGLDGNIYGSGGTTGNIYLLNQSNNTLVNIVNAQGEVLYGASSNGNLLTEDNNGILYCRLASNGYSKSVINMKGLIDSYDNDPYPTVYFTPMIESSHYSILLQSSNYYLLNGRTVTGLKQTGFFSYGIDIDNCQIIDNLHLTRSQQLNTSYGIIGPDSNNNYYIESNGIFSNGSDGD